MSETNDTRQSRSQSRAALNALNQLGDETLAETLNGLSEGNKRLAFVLGNILTELSESITRLNDQLTERVDGLHVRHTEAELVIAKLPSALTDPNAKECFAAMRQRIDIMWRTFVATISVGAMALIGLVAHLAGVKLP